MRKPLKNLSLNSLGQAMVEQISSLKTDIKYKDTHIGKIPVDWEVERLGDISLKFYNGGTPDTANKKYWGGDIPWITGADFEDQKVDRIRRNITHEGLENSATNIVPKGNLLVVTRTGVGKLAIAPFDVAVSQDINGIVLDQRKALPTYLYWYLNHNQNRLKGLLQGTSIDGLLRGDLESFAVSLPAVSEQKKIAVILSTVVEAIEKTTQIIEKTKNLKKGMMKRLLSRGIGHKKFKKTEIGEIPEEWAVVKLKDVAADQRYSFVDGPFGSNLKSIHYVDRGIPVIQSQFVITGKVKPTETFCVSEEKAKELERSKVLPGDIVMAKIGVNYAASATIPEGYPEAVLSGNTMKITPNKDKVVTTFLQHLLHYFREIKAFDGIVSTTAQPAITLEGAKNLRIPLPKIFEQVKISEILNSIDDEIERESEREEQLELLKKGLMQVLLTGKLRVAV
jgi:type I restriction enzyme S subunit